jgi:putative protease
MSEKQRIGTVFTYFAKVGVAGIVLEEGTLKVGESISIEGHTTNIQQTVDSIQIDRQEVEEAGPGSKIGIKTKDRVRPQDVVYRVE